MLSSLSSWNEGQCRPSQKCYLFPIFEMISFSKIGNKSHYWLRFSEIKQSKRLRLYLYPRGFHWILSHSMQKKYAIVWKTC